MRSKFNRGYYRIDGASWIVDRIAERKYALYRKFNDGTFDFFGYYRSLRSALADVSIPEGF